MKKGLVFLFSALLLLGLFVSCENNVDTSKNLVTVKLGAAEGKGLSASVEYASFDDLDWYYKADAASDVFNYGETADWTKLEAGLGDSIELSQGIWSFELKAVEAGADVSESDAVYAGSLMGAQVKAQANDSALSISIPVTAQMAGDGYIAFRDITITLRDGSTATVAPNMAQIDSEEYELPTDESVRLSTGIHDVKVWYVDPSDNMVKAEESVKVTVFGGATTVIEGFLSEITQDVEIGGEDTGSYGDVDPIVSEIVIENQPVVKDDEVVAGVVETTKEAAVSNGALTVKLPVGTKLDVTDEVAAGKVMTGIVEADKTEEAVANISIASFDNVKVFDLTLNVSQDNTTLVEVAYNVGAGLDITQVIHVTDEGENALSSTESNTEEWYSYDPASGVLTLHIFHASYITIAEGDGYHASSIENFMKALEMADENTPIVLLSDISSSEIIVVNKSVTIDGNGKKLTSTAGRAINVSTEGEVVIKDLSIECSGERAINIIQKPVSLTIDNVVASAANYTLNIAASSEGSKVKVANSTLTGLNVVNVAGPQSIVEVDKCTINCEDYNETEGESYSALALNKDATGAQIAATDCTFNIRGDSRIAKNDATDGKILVDNLDDVVSNSEAAIIYPGPYYYSFETLEEAIEFAKSGDTILLLSDVEASEIITINKPLTIDGNDKTLASTAGRAINVEVAGDVIIKNLTIEASGERAINVINQPVNLVVDNVIATADNYAVMVATSVGDSGVPAYISITDSVLTGLNVVNVAAAKSVTTLNSCELNCMDKSDVEEYASLCLYFTASKASIVASNCTFNILGSSSVAYNSSTDGTIVVEGCEVVQGVAYIEYTGGYTYSFVTLEKAIEYAKAGECVNLILDIELDEAITVDKEITINLKGMNLSVKNGSDPIVAAEGYAVDFSEGIYTISK